MMSEDMTSDIKDVTCNTRGWPVASGGMIYDIRVWPVASDGMSYDIRGWPVTPEGVIYDIRGWPVTLEDTQDWHTCFPHDCLEEVVGKIHEGVVRCLWVPFLFTGYWPRAPPRTGPVSAGPASHGPAEVSITQQGCRWGGVDSRGGRGDPRTLPLASLLST